MEPQGNGDSKQIICPICFKTFSTNKNLQNHKLTLHELFFPFECVYPNCTKKYSIESRLKVHARTHLGVKPFKCLECGKCFSEKGNLKTHIKFHSTKRPFTCTNCQKSYKTKGHLKDHIEVQHKGKKKYKCDLCEKDFGRSSTLKAHYRTHTGEKTIKCRIENCNQYFAEKGNMEMHYKRHLSRIQKEESKPFEEYVNENIKNINITRPCSNVTLLNEINSSQKKLFIVNKGNIITGNNKVDGNLCSSSNLVDSNQLIHYDNNDSDENNCEIDNSFIFYFQNQSN